MITLYTGSLSKYGLNRVFQFAKDAGFDGIEIAVDKSNFDTQNAEYISELASEYKIPVLALATPNNATENTVEHVIEMATYLKCPVVVVSPPKILDFKFTNWLKKQTPLIRKKKHIQIALLNASGTTLFGFLPANAMNDMTDLKKFGMVALDCSSTVSKKWDLMRSYEHLKELIVHVHLSNVYHHKDYSLPLEGRGILPLESFLKKLKANGYKGAISVRVRGSELMAGDDEKVIENLKNVKQFIEEYFRS